MSTQPNKFQPGQKVKVTGNKGNYHQFLIDDEVEVLNIDKGKSDRFNETAYKCMNEYDDIDTVFESDLEHLQPLKHD